MQKMYVYAFNLRDEVVVSIKPVGDTLPIVVVQPVANEFLLIAERNSLLPIFNGFGIGIASLPQPG